VQEEPVITTCEYKDCYNTGKFKVACKCIIDTVTPSATAAIIGESVTQGKCKWTQNTACTADAKVCPDGSSVGRNPDRNCEFDPCPVKPVCGNGLCEVEEASYCPPCNYTAPYCEMPCTVGKCPQDCIPFSCRETDGGKNYYKQGSISVCVNAGESVGMCNQFSDKCYNDTLTETYCKESKEAGFEAYKCPSGICKSGACIQQANATQ
jgi:hypothetical protein